MDKCPNVNSIIIPYNNYIIGYHTFFGGDKDLIGILQLQLNVDFASYIAQIHLSVSITVNTDVQKQTMLGSGTQIICLIGFSLG